MNLKCTALPYDEKRKHVFTYTHTWIWMYWLIHTYEYRILLFREHYAVVEEKSSVSLWLQRAEAELREEGSWGQGSHHIPWISVYLLPSKVSDRAVNVLHDISTPTSYGLILSALLFLSHLVCNGDILFHTSSQPCDALCRHRQLDLSHVGMFKWAVCVCVESVMYPRLASNFKHLPLFKIFHLSLWEYRYTPTCWVCAGQCYRLNSKLHAC